MTTNFKFRDHGGTSKYYDRQEEKYHMYLKLRHGDRIDCNNCSAPCCKKVLYDHIIVLAPFKQWARMRFPEVKGVVSDLLADIKHMAVNLGNLNRLYQLCQPYFPQVDPGGTEIQEKIEVILNRMRQTEPVEVETLKSWLSEVMDRFSTLSIMSGLLKRDQITARTYIEENINLLNRWGEINLAGYPTNTLIETIDYNSKLQPFEDFIDRTQALRTQLETISDMVRTYLGIRQQEQSSEMLKQQVKMLHTIEGHEKILKFLTYWVVLLTVVLVTLEVLRIFDILH